LGITNSTDSNDISQFLSHKYSLAFAQTTPSSPSEISNQTQQAQQQQWIDRTNNIRILFRNVPAKPIIDSKTQMRFTVQNLTTNENIKDLAARVVVVTNSSGQLRTFKFTNISSTNGSLAINYIFPDSGLYQILARIDSKDFSSLASFKANVPFQPSNVLNPSSSAFYPLIVTIALLGSILVGIGILMMRKRRRQKKYHNLKN
jgi:hypothetical protein